MITPLLFGCFMLSLSALRMIVLPRLGGGSAASQVWSPRSILLSSAQASLGIAAIVVAFNGPNEVVGGLLLAMLMFSLVGMYLYARRLGRLHAQRRAART